MAHPHIMVDRTAIAELKHAAQQSRRRLVVAVVKAGCHRQAVRRNNDVTNQNGRRWAITQDFADCHPALGRCGELRINAGVGWRNQRDEHTVDVTSKDRIGLARKTKTTRQRIKIKADDRVTAASGCVIPKPHIPASRMTRRITPLNCKRRAVDRIKRHDPGRLPTKAEVTPAIVKRRFIGEQRMIKPILALPDQPGQIIGLVEHSSNVERIRPG